MVDSAIITLLDKNNVCLGDFDLPLKISVDELSRKLLAFLKAKESDTYASVFELKIRYNDRILDKTETLYDNGVWDGSFLNIVY